MNQKQPFLAGKQASSMLLLFLYTLLPVLFLPSFAFTPYRPLRYTHVTGQADWYTCGAAAV